MDWLEVELSNHENEEVGYTYTDFNLDGVLDKMEVDTVGEESKTYILLGRTWKLVTNGEETSSFTAWVQEQGTELLRAEFTGSEWVRTK
jgi:hypothetical protein